MMKKALLIVAVFAAGSLGCVSAQQADPVVKQVSTKKLARMRIIYLKDRIKNQRERVDQGLATNTLTADQAAAGRALLTSVVDKMKAEHQANGAKKTISKEAYEAYNASLDANSSVLKEEKRYFYYYGPYADDGPYYHYYYDAYPAAGAPAPSESVMTETHPKIFELKDRIKNQRERIQRGLNDNTLTSDQAADCRVILKSVQDQMRADFKANGSNRLTKDEYVSFNTSLDTNSTFIRENKQYFYYYGDPNDDQSAVEYERN